MTRSLIDPDLRIKPLESEFISGEECDPLKINSNPTKKLTRRCNFDGCENESIWFDHENTGYCILHEPEEIFSE